MNHMPGEDSQPGTPVVPTELAHAPASGPTGPSTGAKLTAEGLGSFLLVFALIGAMLFGSPLADEPGAVAPGIVYIAASVAVGLALIMAAYAFGPISGGHFNPAVTLGLAAAGRFPWRESGGYIAAQIAGAAAATTAIVLVGLFGPDGWLPAAQDGGFASNGWGPLSPGGFGIAAAVIIEVILSFLFLLVILAATRSRRGTSLAAVVMGLSLALIHFVGIPVDNASVNPARSLATAIYGGPVALAQLWVFLVFPIVGALLAGWSHRALLEGRNGA